jgi:hypothetical protein
VATKKSAIRLDEMKSTYRLLLQSARLPQDNVTFDVRETPGKDNALVGHSMCVVGHELKFSLRELQDMVNNKILNNPEVVPHLCPQCAYPDTDIAIPKKETIYHRLGILRKLNPRVSYVADFDIVGKGPEVYSCGEKFEDGLSHPLFSIRFNKLGLSDKNGKLRHGCYVCAIKAGQVPENKEKTLPMIEGRMKMLADLIDQRVRRRRKAPRVQFADRSDDVLSYAKTQLIFSCNQPDHPSVVSTADSYFSSTKSGYCRRCLIEANARSTKEMLSAQPERPQMSGA